MQCLYSWQGFCTPISEFSGSVPVFIVWLRQANSMTFFVFSHLWDAVGNSILFKYMCNSLSSNNWWSTERVDRRNFKLVYKTQYIRLPLLFKRDISPTLFARCYSTWPISTMLIKCMLRHWTLTRSLSKIRCLAMQVSLILCLIL